ncbi:hypothetical protein C8F01DRAFT_1111083 [Mycena amicta]|nr:hypothetical protein C8F01DRAFT_1111083 [Mycena amicta]
MSEAPQPAPTRARPGGRKKVQHDDAAYFSAASGMKRQAAERAEGEPRTKRKRLVDNSALAQAANRDDGRSSLVEFVKMPTPVLYRYLAHFDLVPLVDPSPITALDPPPPASLDRQQQQHSRAPSPQPSSANRQRHHHTRRRSSRLLDDDSVGRPPIMADIDQLHNVLAAVAERHFAELTGLSGREEVETLASFMCEVERCKKIR